MLPRSGRKYLLFATVPLALLGATGVGAEPAPTPVAGGKSVIAIVLSGRKLEFKGPPTVEEGSRLEIVNETNPRKVGPHTFSLVRKGSLPRTKRAQANCASPGKICFAISRWHRFNPTIGKIGLNPVRVGPAGWSTAGDAAGARGDSWYTGETTSGTHFGQTVSAKAGTTLYYFCAIHPWMQGSIRVVPPAGR